ncbi:hypothetical protein C8F01DRAFT_308884 [Mycena amicta]|nr:hypothetical protein C8F01DRAFT_308884 [Mycena amicta]
MASSRKRTRRATDSDSNLVTEDESSGIGTRRPKRLCSGDAWITDSPLSSVPSTPEPRPKPKKPTTQKTITVNGQELQPTVVFDTLWRWLAERKHLDDKRRKGMPAPWTDDPILQKFKFCQSYRVLDKTCQFLITEVVEKGPQTRDELLFRILLFQSFNRIETWQLLERELGNLTYKNFDIEAYDKVLTNAVKRGDAVFTNAYLKIAPSALDPTKNKSTPGYRRHLILLEHFMTDLPAVIRKAKYAADVYEKIAGYPGCGDFASYQLLLALSYSKLVNFSGNDFVMPGPGCSSGLEKMFGRSLKDAKAEDPDIESHILRWLVDNQTAQFNRLGLEFSFLRSANGQELMLELPDLEHAVCEVDKYARIAHPRIKGKKTEMKARFSPTSESLLATPALPQAWSDPARRVSRIRKGPIMVEKLFIVERIIQERIGEDNEVEYLVDWQGYGEEHRTWQPHRSLAEDVPTIVKEWRKKQGAKKNRI